MTRDKPNREIAEEAAGWAVRLDAGALGETERRALAQWLGASPVHVDELLFAASILSGLEHVDADGAVSIDALLTAQAPKVIPLFAEVTSQSAKAGEAAEPAPWRTSRMAAGSGVRWMAIAATVLLMAVGAFFVAPSFLALDGQPATIAYHTQAGEQRSITLEDGSIVHMNTGSQLRVTLSREERRVDLLRGEALFEVAHSPERPFRVYADDIMSQAVGTKFNVLRDKGGVHVMVMEGKVLVRNGPPAQFGRSAGQSETQARTAATNEVLVLAGNRADVEQDFVAPKVSPANISEAVLWRMEQLSFDNQTLAAIAAEFNRYNRMQMVVADARLAGTRFSGAFNSNDPESFLAFLELTPGVTVNRSDPERIVITLQK